jgi:hypothetical protein
MIIFVFALLVLSILVLVILDRFNLRPAIIWLFAAVVAAIVWVGIFSLQYQLPQMLSFLTWESKVVGFGSLWMVSPSLLLDSISWPFAIALTTISVGLIFTLVIQDQDQKFNFVIDSGFFITIFGLLALGLISVFSGNPLVLVMTWGGIDLFELFFMLKSPQDGQYNNKFALRIFARVLGTLLLLWGVIVARNGGVILEFEQVYPRARFFLLWASVFRLGGLPIRLGKSDLPHQHGLDLMFNLTLVATSLVLVPRAVLDSSLNIITPYLLGATGLAALYGGLNWMIVRDEFEGYSFWMMGSAAIAIATALNGQALVSLTWGVGLLLGWGFLVIFSARDRLLRIFVLIELIGIFMLPFIVSEAGSSLYTGSIQWLTFLFLTTHALLLSGFIRHTFREGDRLKFSMRGVWAIYVLGLGIFPLTHFFVGWRLWTAGESHFGLLWQGIFVVGLSVLALYATEKVSNVLSAVFSTVQSVSLNWVYRLFERGYQVLVKLVSFLTMLLEGEGGILWALLLLLILVSLVTQWDFGS